MKHAERANLARERTLRIEAEKQVKELKALVARYEQEAKATQEALAKSIQQVSRSISVYTIVVLYM